MDNVIRNDVVKLDFDVGSALKNIQKLSSDYNALEKQMSGQIDDGAFDNLGNDVNDSAKKMEKASRSAKSFNERLKDIGKKGSVAAFNGLKKVAGISFKALTVGIAGAATATGVLVKNAVTAYADYEQLVGGVDTLFKNSSNKVQKYANDAYKTAGLSANAYMETVTSFSASLIQSLDGDTEKAADLAHTAIVDMSDNANKMGSDMSLLQTAYNGFAKQNYTMLDNLKLGYGGTKTEMERLIKDAAKIDKSVDANSMSYANIVKAIHAVQTSMDITGTTSKEASSTIAGSLGSMKSAWGNLMPALIKGGDSFDQCVDNLVSSVKTFGKNIKPAILKALKGVGSLVEELAPEIEKEFPKLVDDLLPPLLSAGTSLLKAFIKAIPSLAKSILKELPDIFKGVGSAISEAFGDSFPFLKKFGEFCAENAGKIAKLAPAVLGIVGAFMAFKKIKSIGGALSGLFGSKGGAGEGEGGNKKGGMFGWLTELGKVKTTTVLKGMANLAIILGGMTVLTAAFVAVAPHLAKLGDAKSTLTLIATIGALGLVGGELTKFAGIAGKMPISTVLKGLANIGLVVGGMSVLFLLMGAVSLAKFDYGRILKLVGIIGALGTVGSVLTVFAGIVGLIPIPVVLAGLANMALVLGGVTALIVAYGALGKIKGFNEFIEVGGKTLAKVFNVIGECVGSVIGGLGEGITNSLPKIGTNLSKFAETLKPMFSAFSGVDMGGVGAFFKAIGTFMLQMAGNKILEFFTGKTDFSGVAEGLNSFAKNDGAKNFFKMVNGIQEEAFNKGKLFFECLSKVKSLPNAGGLGQLFGGKNDFSGVATGLGQLSGENVKKFFTMVAGFKEVAFENCKSFFTAVDSVSKLPNVGSFATLFTGKNDYSGVAKGLGHLSKEGVKNFFAMVSKLDASVFPKVTALFESLSNIGKVGKQGFLESIGNLFKSEDEKTSNLSLVAKGLGDFASKAAPFFTLVNSIDIQKLNALWDSLKSAGKITVDNLTVVFDEGIKHLVEKITELPLTMGNALKSNSKGLSDGMTAMWKDAVKASVAPVNKLLAGANHILKEFGSDKRVIEWEPYARGTDGHRGGNALVNDGRGAELLQMPNGRMFIANGRNVFLPNAPKGMKVLPAEQTARLLGKTSPTFRYADGIGDLDVWSFYDNAKGLVDAITKHISYKGMSGYSENLGRSMVSTFAAKMPAWVDKMFEACGQSISAWVSSKGVTQWLPTVVRALKMEGQYSLGNVARTLFQMKTESGGNPHAINLWDSNAKKGIPSKGLMQVIDPTFKAYARNGFDKDIYDPLSNVLASIRYAVSRYGSLSKAYRGVGYSRGVGEISMPTTPVQVTYTPEGDRRRVNTQITEHNTYSPQFTLNISGTQDDRELARKVKQWIAEAMTDMFEGVARQEIREV